jgi:hypothetical protein
MKYATVEDVIASFPHPILPSVQGEPDYQTIHAIRKLLQANARAIYTHLGGGLGTPGHHCHGGFLCHGRASNTNGAYTLGKSNSPRARTGKCESMNSGAVVGRLFQGIHDLLGINTSFFVELKNIPKDRQITYGKIVCD